MLRYVVQKSGEEVLASFREKYRKIIIELIEEEQWIHIIWESKVCQDRDSTVKGLEEIFKEKIIIKKEDEEVIQEEGVIKEENQRSQDIFQEI